jgi:hypothetical protein
MIAAEAGPQDLRLVRRRQDRDDVRALCNARLNCVGGPMMIESAREIRSAAERHAADAVAFDRGAPGHAGGPARQGQTARVALPD